MDITYMIHSLLHTYDFSLPRSCQHSGCTEEFPSDEIEKHEIECQFQPITCVMPICSAKIPFNSIQNHLSTHGVMGNLENATLPNIQEVTTSINTASINICIWAWPVHLCYDQKNFFGLCGKYLNGTFLWIYGLEMEEECKKYQAIIEVSNTRNNDVRKF